MSMTRIKGLVFTSILTTIASFAGSHAYTAIHDHGRALVAGACLAALAGVGVYLIRKG